mmetsp:Transcript_22921/g.34752  ORF Transcript_22921/g.34752 Transcript_22921/m.34752 type:complete len:247 (+) Transcript_22921:2689-3429(+)
MHGDTGSKVSNNSTNDNDVEPLLVSKGKDEENGVKTDENNEEWADIERTCREKVATKNDEAAVPEYLGCDHLVNDFEWKRGDGLRREWTEKELDALPGVMTALQRLAFLWWKPKLQREFEGFLRKKVQKLHRKFRFKLIQTDVGPAPNHEDAKEGCKLVLRGVTRLFMQRERPASATILRRAKGSMVGTYKVRFSTCGGTLLGRFVVGWILRLELMLPRGVGDPPGESGQAELDLFTGGGLNGIDM